MQFIKLLGDIKNPRKCIANALRYDPGIPSVMPVAGGCLTMKKQCDARLFSQDAWLFLLTLVTFSYFFYWW